MAMPEAAWEVVEQMAAKYPLPQGQPGSAHEEACRAWTRRVCEQLRFEFGPAWGHKAASPSRPPSKDTCARKDVSGFIGWDLMTGAGTGSPVLSTYPPPEHDLTGQFFIEVEPINHLGTDPEPPTPPPSDLEERVSTLEREVDELVRRMAGISSAAGGE